MFSMFKYVSKTHTRGYFLSTRVVIIIWSYNYISVYVDGLLASRMNDGIFRLYNKCRLGYIFDIRYIMPGAAEDILTPL